MKKSFKFIHNLPTQGTVDARRDRAAGAALPHHGSEGGEDRATPARSGAVRRQHRAEQRATASGMSE